MNYLKIISLFIFVYYNNLQSNTQDTWIRINQLGYLTNSVKVAVLVSKDDLSPDNFSIKDALTKSVVFESNKIRPFGDIWSFKSTFRLDFSELQTSGAFFIECDGIKSPDSG